MKPGPLQLARAELLDFAGYKSARSQNVSGDIWLNANEAAWPNQSDQDDMSRRYPEPQPQGLRTALAELYGVAPEQVLVGRGSDEGIDLLVRAFCMPGRDAILVTPPVFGMYAVSARLQGAQVVEVPLRDTSHDFCVDMEAVANAAERDASIRLVFLCSPGNPAGAVISRDAIVGLAQRLEGRALVVIDEAYVEFADVSSMAPEVSRQHNLVVLRTLSKAHALAAARIGTVIANADVIALLRRCQAPYPVPAPSAALALAALRPECVSRTMACVDAVRRARTTFSLALNKLACVKRVYPSQANFLLVRVADTDAALGALLAAGIVVRDQRGSPQLDDALRITVGTPVENERVVQALRTLEDPA